MIKTLFRSHCKSILGYLSHVFHISIGLSANTTTKICTHQFHVLLIVEVNLDSYDNYEVNQSLPQKTHQNNLRTEPLLLLRNGQAPPPVTNWNRQHPREVFGLHLEIYQIHFEKIVQKILPCVPCFLNAD